jgi:2EXR family protein
VVLSEFKSKPYTRLLNLTSFTPPPIIFHVCRESRSLGLMRYKKISCTLVRYVWFNPDIDTVKLCSCVLSIGRYPGLEKLKHVSIILHDVQGDRLSMNDLDDLSTHYPGIETLDLTFPMWFAKWCNETLDDWSEVLSDVTVRRIQVTARDGIKDTNMLERKWSQDEWSETGLRCTADVDRRRR